MATDVRTYYRHYQANRTRRKRESRAAQARRWQSASRAAEAQADALLGTTQAWRRWEAQEGASEGPATG